MSYKEIRHIKQIIKELKKSNFKIIIVTKDITFMDDLVEELIVINNKKEVYRGDTKDVFNEPISIMEPNIVKFINMANRKGANLNMTLDNKELLKDIYRSVGK